MTKIAVTSKEYHKAANIFEFAACDGLDFLECPSEERSLVGFIEKNNIDHVIVGVENYVGPLYESLRPTSLIARFGVGFNSLDLKKATHHQLVCTNTPGALTTSVAEHAMALILNASKNISKFNHEMHAGQFSPCMSSEIKNKQLTIIGTGKVGQGLAQMATYGFGMRVVGVNNPHSSIDKSLLQKGFFEITLNLNEGVAEADYISLHLPENSKTSHLINASALQQIPEKAWLINTSRGGLINEEDLFDALIKNKIAGASLDVFNKEPYEPFAKEKDFRLLENVHLTPHVSSTTTEACNAMAECCLKNVQLIEEKKYHEMDLINRPRFLQNEIMQVL